LVKISKVFSFDGSYYQAHTLTNSEQILNKSKKNSLFQPPQAKYSLTKKDVLLRISRTKECDIMQQNK